MALFQGTHEQTSHARWGTDQSHDTTDIQPGNEFIRVTYRNMGEGSLTGAGQLKSNCITKSPPQHSDNLKPGGLCRTCKQLDMMESLSSSPSLTDHVTLDNKSVVPEAGDLFTS